MTCEYYVEMISAALDNELTDIESHELENHLSECCGCRRLQDRMGMQAAKMRDQTIPQMPESLRVRIKQDLATVAHKPVAPVWHIYDDRYSMRSASKKTIRNTILQMGPWGRAI